MVDDDALVEVYLYCAVLLRLYPTIANEESRLETSLVKALKP